MKQLRVVEVRDSQLCAWADGLDLEEKITLGLEKYWQRWGAWTMAMNWLARHKIRIAGVLGWIGPLEEDRRVLLVIESDETPPVPPFANL